MRERKEGKRFKSAPSFANFLPDFCVDCARSIITPEKKRKETKAYKTPNVHALAVMSGHPHTCLAWRQIFGTSIREASTISRQWLHFSKTRGHPQCASVAKSTRTRVRESAPSCSGRRHARLERAASSILTRATMMSWAWWVVAAAERAGFAMRIGPVGVTPSMPDRVASSRWPPLSRTRADRKRRQRCGP